MAANLMKNGRKNEIKNGILKKSMTVEVLHLG
jgi:hypothetical protein